MMTDNLGEPVEIRLDLGYRISVPIGDEIDEYESNYIRAHRGPIILVHGEGELEREIGEIEIRYIDGERALEKNLDIVDICDSIDQATYEYAFAIYEDGTLDRRIVGEAVISEDVLVLHSISLLPSFRRKGYGLSISRKLIETIGGRCGAALLRPAPLQFSRDDDREWTERMGIAMFTDDREAATKKLVEYWKRLNLRKTKHPKIFCVLP